MQVIHNHIQELTKLLGEKLDRNLDINTTTLDILQSTNTTPMKSSRTSSTINNIINDIQNISKSLNINTTCNTTPLISSMITEIKSLKQRVDLIQQNDLDQLHNHMNSYEHKIKRIENIIRKQVIKSSMSLNYSKNMNISNITSWQGLDDSMDTSITSPQSNQSNANVLVLHEWKLAFDELSFFCKKHINEYHEENTKQHQELVQLKQKVKVIFL